MLALQQSMRCLWMKTNKFVLKSYERHYSQITEKMAALLTKIKNEVVKKQLFSWLFPDQPEWVLLRNVTFLLFQEVYATRTATKK